MGHALLLLNILEPRRLDIAHSSQHLEFHTIFGHLRLCRSKLLLDFSQLSLPRAQFNPAKGTKPYQPAPPRRLCSVPFLLSQLAQRHGCCLKCLPGL